MKRPFIIPLISILLLCSCEKMYFGNMQNNPKYIFDTFWNQVDRNYSFFGYLHLNWDSVRTVYAKKINENTTPKELSQLLGEMIQLLKDGHSDLYTGFATYYYTGWYSNYPVNQLPSINNYFGYLASTQDHNIFYGKIYSTNIGYIYISTFEGDSSAYSIIDQILTQFSTTDGIIIDVRSNGGGNTANGTVISKRFADSVRFICKDRYRNGPGHDDFTPWYNEYTRPGGNVHYGKPVAVLTNRLCYSATSHFLLEMSVLPQVVVIGDTTGGGSAQPITRELPNGWIVRVSNSQRLTPEGRDYQFTGLYPDIPVWITHSDAVKRRDTILETAIRELEKSAQ